MTNNPTILITEDEVHIREIWDECLTMNGYNVLLSSNGLEAIEHIKESHIDLIITDINMPISNGIKILEYLDSHELDIKTIVCSGYEPTDEGLQNFSLEKVIRKPFDVFEEVDFINQLLNN